MTTELQKLALDALDMLGPMTYCELETACLIGPKHRGGFRSSLNWLFERKFVECDECQIRITADGVYEVERVNQTADKRSVKD